MRHAPVLPYKATYSPWLTDPYFLSAFECIEDHTLVDRFRCYELWSLVRESAKLGEGALLEVGVWRGGTGCLIGSAADEFGIPNQVYLCDTFRGVVKAGPMDTRYRGGEHADTSCNIVQMLSSSMGLDNIRILEGIFPDETAYLIEESSYRFVHIDVDVYESARDILDYVWPRLVVGGMVVFDDYGTHGCEGVTRVVNETAPLEDRIFFHNLNGHGVLIKLPKLAVRSVQPDAARSGLAVHVDGVDELHAVVGRSHQ